MLNMGGLEMMVVALVVILFIGPKGIPKLMKDVRGWIKSLRALSRDLTSSFDDMVKDTEFKDAAEMLKDARSFNPRAQISKMIDPDGETEKALKSFDKDFKDFDKDASYLNSSPSSNSSSSDVAMNESATSVPSEKPNALLDEAIEHREKLERKAEA